MDLGGGEAVDPGRGQGVDFGRVELADLGGGEAADLGRGERADIVDRGRGEAADLGRGEGAGQHVVVERAKVVALRLLTWVVVSAASVVVDKPLSVAEFRPLS